MVGLKLPKFNPPKFAAGPQKASSAAASHQPATAQSPKASNPLDAFKAQIKGLNLNQPALPQTAAKTQKFGGWVG